MDSCDGYSVMVVKQSVPHFHPSVVVAHGWKANPETDKCLSEVDHGTESTKQGSDNSNRMQGVVMDSRTGDGGYSLARWNYHHLLALYVPSLLIV